MYYIGSMKCDPRYLEHFGVKGQKWGIRRYENPDGTLTEEGKKRYNEYSGREKTEIAKHRVPISRYNKDRHVVLKAYHNRAINRKDKAEKYEEKGNTRKAEKFKRKAIKDIYKSDKIREELTEYKNADLATRSRTRFAYGMKRAAASMAVYGAIKYGPAMVKYGSTLVKRAKRYYEMTHRYMRLPMPDFIRNTGSYVY